jgi:hypothetical protein
MHRLRNRKEDRAARPPPRPDPQVLIEGQSLRGAIVAAIVAMLICSWFWMYLAILFGRVFPWISVIQGALIGLAVRRFGRGFDWRFPLVAGLIAWTAAFFGNLLIAVPTTSDELGVSPLEVIRGLTWWSFEVFFDEVITVVDYIYAFCAVAVAMFYSKRRLSRHEVFALRTKHK